MLGRAPGPGLGPGTGLGLGKEQWRCQRLGGLGVSKGRKGAGSDSGEERGANSWGSQMRRESGLAALVMGAVLLGGLPAVSGAQVSDDDWVAHCQRQETSRNRERYCEARVKTIASGGTISVDPGRNGGVTVLGWDGSEIEIHARIQAQARSEGDARSLADEVRVVNRGTTIGTDGPSTGDGESWSVSFVVHVPRRSDVSLEAHNGPVRVADVTGQLRVRAQNGPVTVSGVGGDVRVRAVNGPLRVELAGKEWTGAGLDAETRNGPIHLAIPDGYSARLETGTVNGPMRTDIPLKVTLEGRISRRITAVLGSGGAPLRVVTTNGPVTISRR